jgi:hypothetical protein
MLTCDEGEVVLSLGGSVFVSRVRSVGRFGVDLDWKPGGTGGGFSPVPLLCGGILDYMYTLP